MLEIYNYNAGAGDCLRLHFSGASGQSRNVIIDSGVTSFGLRFKDIYEEIHNQGESIDALIITHSDEDHLGGLLWNLQNSSHRKAPSHGAHGMEKVTFSKSIPIKEAWMNHGGAIEPQASLSVQQRDEVYTRLCENGITVKKATAGMVFDIDGVDFKILWPPREMVTEVKTICTPSAQLMASVQLGRHSDYGYSLDELMNRPLPSADTSTTNQVSIVFETCIDECKMLFTGDARAKEIIKVCGGGFDGRHNAVKYDLIKLPHHGSARNISEKWSQKIICSNYIIPADGIARPDKQTIAKLLKEYGKVQFFISSDWWRGMLKPEDAKYKDTLRFTEGEKMLWKK